MKKLPKIVVILGPTASGKSTLAVELARQFNGEVVSADSRQVYRDLNIGTGKITQREMRGIPHHLLDVADPRRQFTVVEFKMLAEKAIDDILSRGKLPILCGGTGFYIQSIVDGVVLPEVPENAKLRASLSKLSAERLFAKLKKLDPKRAKTIDSKNPVRLIRAIEIASAVGYVPRIKMAPRYETLQIGTKIKPELLKGKIEKRLAMRMKKGMIAEARKLHKAGLSLKRMDSLGLEYRHLAKFLQKEISKKEMEEQLAIKTCQYAKRQMQWFIRDRRIKWLAITETKRIKSAVKKFLE